MALAECSQVDECKDWADKAAALASYARQSQDYEMEKTAMRIRSRAIKRCGELLKEVEAKKGGDRKSKDRERPIDRKTAADEAGMSPRQAKDAIRVANVPQETFERLVESDNPPTITALAELGKKPAPTKPIYEKLGMTKEQFQAGTYFRGAIGRYVEALREHGEGVAGGLTPEERKQTLEDINTIDTYHRRLKADL
jgi:hypothetical protein